MRPTPAPLGNHLTWRNLGIALLLTFLGALVLYILADYIERYAEKKEEELEKELEELEDEGEVF
ncbi:hypothetical protein [Thermococcus sp.]